MQFPQWPKSDEREVELLRDVLDSPQWGGFHPFITQFEHSFAAYQHCEFGLAAMNGTVTLELALSVLGVGAGDEVIVPAISFISTATAVSRAGAMPVFVDIEPERVREAVTSKTKAVIAVHFGGTLCRIEEISAICLEHGLELVEDAAHAQGSEWNGRRAGSFGRFGSFSFQNGKVMSAGEGGILVTSDAALAKTAASVLNQGREEGRGFFEHHRLGTNFRMTAFQAAVLLAQLERLPAQIAQRTTNVERIQLRLGSDNGIVWQQQPAEVTANSQYLLLGRIQHATVTRDQFCGALKAEGVPCTPFYPHTLYQNPVYKAGGRRVMPCPNAEACVDDAFWLPHRVLLAAEETIDKLIEVTRCAITEKGNPASVAARTASHPGAAS